MAEGGTMTIANQKFSDYVTSGAFNMSLSRGQISELAMLADSPAFYVNRVETLERRGLVEAVPRRTATDFDAEQVEYRLTAAGLLTVQLLHAAGLTNQGEATLVREVETLRAELAAARDGERRALLLAQSFRGRLKWLQDRIARVRDITAGRRFTVHILRRDANPGVCTRCLSEELDGIVQ
jgi:hypothetical protein